MKRCLVLFIILAFSLPLITPVVVVSQSDKRLWALIVTGWFDLDLDPGYLERVLSKHYSFSGIKHLVGYPNNKQTVRNAITSWLKTCSDSNDLIFIFIFSHGGGFNAQTGKMEGGRVDGSQGDPIDELDGVDECIAIKMYEPAPTAQYWDDEVKEDLDTLNYGTLVFMYQGCKIENGTEGCFSGGFVRDLSKPNRIIIATSNETTHSHGGTWPGVGYPYGYFSREFIRALDVDGYTKLNQDGTPMLNSTTGDPIWVDSFGLADITDDGKVTIREAFEYAWQNDPARLDGRETPQLDDNPDGIPNTMYEGSLSLTTYFGTETLHPCDLNLDGKIDMRDVSIASRAFGSYPGHERYNIRAAVVCDDLPFGYEDEPVTMRDVATVARAFGTTY